MKKTVSVIMILAILLTAGGAAFADSYGITVTRHPSAETHFAGESASFAAGANFYETADWTFVAPSGMEFGAQEFRSLFPSVVMEGEHTNILTLHNLTAELDGWAVYCSFHSSNDNANTRWAFLNVFPNETFPGFGYPMAGNS